ncbi:MAG: 50S ribosomal protein L25 [bacterium]|nr:50S ribosomal protein L25 [bacterium]
MITLQATKREKKELPQTLRSRGVLPAVAYGPKLTSSAISVDLKEFNKVFEESGETSLIQLEWNGEKASVFVVDVQRDPLSHRPMHVDFYQPILDKVIEVDVPLVFQGEAPAVKDLGGTFIRNMNEVTVRALPQNIPHEIMVDVLVLKTFDDVIAVKDLHIQEGVQITQDPEEVIAQVVPAEDVDEQLATPIEENVEDIQKSEEKGKKEEDKEGEEKED